MFGPVSALREGLSVILHIPHASRTIPPEVRPTLLLTDEELQRELILMTDAYTDDLFHVSFADCVRFPVSRLVVDPERFIDDSIEPMAQKGMGAVYVRTSHGTTLRGSITNEQRQRLIEEFYRPHHARLDEAVTNELRERGKSLMVDCHSFSSRPLPCDEDQTPDRPDFCIGTDDYHTPKVLSNLVHAALQRGGRSVEVNRPFGGVLVPSSRYRVDRRVQAIMLEVNRSLYLNEETGFPVDQYSGIKSQVAQLLSTLFHAWSEDSLK
jgi:N-formylglutamate amidohydrolase